MTDPSTQLELAEVEAVEAISTDASVERRRLRPWTSNPRRNVVALTAAFVLIELCGAVVGIPTQVALTAAATFYCVNLAIFGYRTNRTAGVVMAAVFTSRLFTLSIPAQAISVPTRTLLVALATIGVVYIATWVLGIDLKNARQNEGFPLLRPWVSRGFTAAATALIGFPLGWLAYQTLGPEKLPIQPLFGTEVTAWILAALFLVAGAFADELLYRRLVAAMVQHTGRSQTPWISAALYGSIFLGTQDPVMVVLATLAGGLWAWSCERTGSLEPVVVSHAVVNLLVFVILPL